MYIFNNAKTLSTNVSVHLSACAVAFQHFLAILGVFSSLLSGHITCKKTVQKIVQTFQTKKIIASSTDIPLCRSLPGCEQSKSCHQKIWANYSIQRPISYLKYLIWCTKLNAIHYVHVSEQLHRAFQNSNAMILGEPIL